MQLIPRDVEEVEEEYYPNGRLKKRTVRRRIPRTIEPLTPLKDTDPWEKIRRPWEEYERRNPTVYVSQGPPPEIRM